MKCGVISMIKIIEMDIGDIRPYRGNPRKNNISVEPLKRSIEKYGFNVPIIIDNEGEIITGHTRYKAAKELGIKKIPCIKKEELSTKEIKEYRIADNKVGELSEWDEPLLKIEFEELNELGSELKDLGFSKRELDEILNFDGLFDFEEEEKPKGSSKIICPACGHEFKKGKRGGKRDE